MSTHTVEVKGEYWPVELKLATQFSTYGPDEPVHAWAQLRGVITNQQARAKCEVVYVLDTSGSMSATMPLVQKIMHFIAQTSPLHHHVSVITFESAAHVIFPMTQMTSEAKQILAEKALPPGAGLTNLCPALYQGMQQFTRDSTCPKTLILLSDGAATTGLTSSEDILEILKKHPLWGQIRLFAVALGEHVDRPLLTDLVAGSQGKMYSIKDADELPLVFGDCLGTLMTMCLGNVTVEMESEYPVRDRRLTVATAPTRPDPTQRVQTFALGNLHQGEQRTLVYRVAADAGRVWLRIMAQNAVTGEPFTLERSVEIKRQDTIPSVRTEVAEVAIELLRQESRQIIEGAQPEELKRLHTRLVSTPWAQTAEIQGLIADLDRLLQLGEAQETQGPPLMHRQVSFSSRGHSSYEEECASVSLRLSSADMYDVPLLRREVTQDCFQHCSYPSGK